MGLNAGPILLFWGLGIFGGLSLLSSHQTLLTTLSWLLFVYAAAVLTPLARELSPRATYPAAGCGTGQRASQGASGAASAFGRQAEPGGFQASSQSRKPVFVAPF